MIKTELIHSADEKQSQTIAKGSGGGRPPNSKYKSHKSLQLKNSNRSSQPNHSISASPLFSIWRLNEEQFKKKKIQTNRAPKFYEVRIKSSQVKKRRPTRGDESGPPASPSPAAQRSNRTSGKNLRRRQRSRRTPQHATEERPPSPDKG